MKKILALFVAMMLFAGMSFAQLGLGAQANYSMYFQGTGIKTLSLGLYGDYCMDGETYLLRFSFNYGIPYKQSYAYTATAYSGSTTPQSILVNTDVSLGLVNIWFDGKKIFGDGDYEEGGVYAFFGGGLVLASVKYKPDSYDSANYDLGMDPSGETEKFTQWLIRGGIGYDIGLEFGNLFAETYLNIPATSYNSRTGFNTTINIPGSFGINAGLRIGLGD